MPNGAHLAAQVAYAEVEVMKMMMPVLTPAAGMVHLVLPEGSVLAAGDLIARMELDDAAAVRLLFCQLVGG